MRPPKPTSRELKLTRENDTLKTEIIGLRHKLTAKQDHVQRLEYLLCARLTRIDALNNRIAQLRDQNKRLDEEAERLVAMMQLTPGDPL